MKVQEIHVSNDHTCVEMVMRVHGNICVTTEGQKTEKQISIPKGTGHILNKSKTICMQKSFW